MECVNELFFTVGAVKSVALYDSIKDWSVKELKTRLREELSADRNVVKKLLDKKELQALAQSLMRRKIQGMCLKTYQPIVLNTCLVLLITIIMIKWRQDIFQLLKQVSSSTINVYQLKYRMHLIKKCTKKYRAVFGAAALAVAIIVDLISSYVQISIFLSWVVPSHSIFSKFLWFGVPFHVKPSDLIPRNNRGGINQPDQSSSGWSFNAGSMLTLAALRYICQQLDEYGLRQLLHAKGVSVDTFSTAAAGGIFQQQLPHIDDEPFEIPHLLRPRNNNAQRTDTSSAANTQPAFAEARVPWEQPAKDDGLGFVHSGESTLKEEILKAKQREGVEISNDDGWLNGDEANLDDDENQGFEEDAHQSD